MEYFTIRFDEYLKQGYTIPDNIDDFIELDIDDNKYNIRQMFTLRNKYKEIGAETQELFKHNLEVSINEALVLFNPKLRIIQDSYLDMLKRTVEESEEIVTSDDYSNQNYLQPSNTSATKLTDMNKSGGTRTINRTTEKSFGIFKSNAEIMETALKVNTIINDIMKYLDRNFIGTI